MVVGVNSAVCGCGAVVVHRDVNVDGPRLISLVYDLTFERGNNVGYVYAADFFDW